MTPVPCPAPGCDDVVTGRFCESCGFDVETGVPGDARLTLDLSADRAHWEQMVGSGEPAFPDALPEVQFHLPGDSEQATFGRARRSATTQPDLALTGDAADPAVSHQQCVFERRDGRWTVRDAGSANGTWINGATTPLDPGSVHALAEGDRICVGAWTCLTVHLASA